MEFLCVIPLAVLFVIAGILMEQNKAPQISEEELRQNLIRYKIMNNINGINYQQATGKPDPLHPIDPKFPPHL